MKKRLVSIILTAFLVLSMMPFAAFADNAIVCPACGGEVTKKQYHLVGNYWDFYQCNTCGKWAYLSGVVGLKLLSAGDQAIINAADANAILNFAFNNGKLIPAEEAPTGIGRKDLPGYNSSDNSPGMPTVSQAGNITLLAKYYFTSDRSKIVSSFSKQVGNDIWNFGESSLSIERYSNKATSCYTYCGYILDTNNVPGVYYIPAGTTYVFNPWGNDKVRSLNDRQWPEIVSTAIASVSSDGSKRYLSIYHYNASSPVAYPSMILSAGNGTDMLFGQDSGYSISTESNITIPYPKDLVVYLRPTSTRIVKSTNITINNNTWNGNIYQDNSTNLTYIYPEYITINENGDTITNISTNPIIYNNEEHKYYTYDTVTNNYYYISYGTSDPSATPTPSPTIKPGGGSTRGGGVGRTPSDTTDWYKSYYILNDYDYDCYYGNFYVDNGQGNTYGTSKTRVSTTAIPIADGTYKVTVPDGVNWRAWRWDEDAKKAVAVNSDTWKSSMYYDFCASEDIIFEFRKADGSEINPRNIVLRLDNSTITEYEPGGKKHEETIDPILPDTRNRIIPNMTSDSFSDSHGKWVASASTTFGTTYNPYNAFNSGTGWWTSGSGSGGKNGRELPCWVQIEIPDPENYCIDGYVVKGAKSGEYFDGWTLQASNDGTTWTDLDSQSSVDTQSECSYDISLHKAYKYYRLKVTSYPTSYFGVGTFNLYGYNADDVIIPTPTPSPSPDPTEPPTPTATPNPGGGGTVPTPGGDPGGSGGSSGGDSWNPFKWLTDLLKDIIEGILKAIWKLITSLFGFLLWLLSLVGDIFPFIPVQAVTAITASVVIVAVIKIIKFITGR